jgi:hypothetical protein
MSRPVRLLLALAALVAVAALAPVTAGAKAPAKKPADPAKVAARDFAVYRRAAKASDRIPAIPKVGAAALKELRTGASRLVASGSDFAVYVVMRRKRADVLYVVRQDGRAVALGSRRSTRLSTLASDGLALTQLLPSGLHRVVVVVPDHVRGVRHGGQADGEGLRKLRNAIVDVAAGGTIEARDREGRLRLWPIPPAEQQHVRVTAEILEGGVHFDDGKGFVQDVRLAGKVFGVIPGGYQLARDNTFELTDSSLTIGVDAAAACAAKGQLVVDGALSSVALDPTQPSSATIGEDGTVSATAAVVLRAVLGLPTEDGCNRTTTGYADTPLKVTLSGRLGNGDSLARMTLTSAPTPLTVNACLAASAGDQPCSSAPTPLAGTVSVKLVVSVKLG